MRNFLRTSDGTAGGRFVARRARRLVAALVIVAAGTTPALAMPQHDGPVTVNEDGGNYRVAATFTVPDAPSFAIATLTDYPNIPRFVPEVRSSTIVERRDGLVVVQQEAVASVLMFSKRIHLLLEVRESQNIIQFRDRCGRSFARYEGSWTMRETDAGTEIRYELSAKPAFDVPEFLLKRLLKRDATRMIERLRAEIAARARGTSAATYRP